MSNKNAIDLIFSPNFDITKVDPNCIDDSFIITALIHDLHHVSWMDEYLKEDHIEFLIHRFNKEITSNNNNFLKYIKIMPRMERYWLNKLKTAQLTYGSVKLMFFKSPDYSYQIKSGNTTTSFRNNGKTYFPAVSVPIICHFLIENQTCPHFLLKEIEQHYIEEMAKYINHKTSPLGPTEYENNELQLAIIRKHPNYSLSKMILDQITPKDGIKNG